MMLTGVAVLRHMIPLLVVDVVIVSYVITILKRSVKGQSRENMIALIGNRFPLAIFKKCVIIRSLSSDNYDAKRSVA